MAEVRFEDASALTASGPSLGRASRTPKGQRSHPPSLPGVPAGEGPSRLGSQAAEPPAGITQQKGLSHPE